MQKDLHLILEQSPLLADAMLELCIVRQWLQTSINVVEFQQYLTQALWVKDSTLKQLPHFTDAEVRHCVSGKQPIKTLAQFLRTDPENRKGMSKFTDAEKEDVDRVCTVMPDVEMEVCILNISGINYVAPMYSNIRKIYVGTRWC